MAPPQLSPRFPKTLTSSSSLISRRSTASDDALTTLQLTGIITGISLLVILIFCGGIAVCMCRTNSKRKKRQQEAQRIQEEIRRGFGGDNSYEHGNEAGIGGGVFPGGGGTRGQYAPVGMNELDGHGHAIGEMDGGAGGKGYALGELDGRGKMAKPTELP